MSRRFVAVVDRGEGEEGKVSSSGSSHPTSECGRHHHELQPGDAASGFAFEGGGADVARPSPDGSDDGAGRGRKNDNKRPRSLPSSRRGGGAAAASSSPRPSVEELGEDYAVISTLMQRLDDQVGAFARTTGRLVSNASASAPVRLSVLMESYRGTLLEEEEEEERARERRKGGLGDDGAEGDRGQGGGSDGGGGAGKVTAGDGAGGSAGGGGRDGGDGGALVFL